MSEQATYRKHIEALAQARRPEQHPEPQVLIDYHERRLQPDAVEEIQDHLALCPQCASAIIDLARFPEIPASLTAEEEEQALKQLRNRLELTASQGPPVPSNETAGWFSWRTIAAAALLVASLQAIWIVHLSRQATVGNSLIIDLFDTTVVRRSIDPERTTEIPPWVDTLVWVLNTNSLESYPRYELEVAPRNATESIIWSGSVVRDQSGSFKVSIPRSSMPAGDYVFRLFGLDEGERRPLARFERTVVLEHPKDLPDSG